MSRRPGCRIFGLLAALIILAALSAACLNRLPAGEATPTPTKTPRPAVSEPAVTTPPTATVAVADANPAATPVPTASPVLVAASATASPLPVAAAATATPSPTEVAATATTVPATAVPVATATAVPAATPEPTAPPPPTAPPAPAVDFVIGELRVLGLNENNGGIESGGQHSIFVTVLDAAGNPIDGVSVVNTGGYPGQAVTGDKGPGKTEIVMWQEVFRLKVESVNGQAASSETSHQMSLIDPLPADIAGRLGDACPTVDNCPRPPYKHFSYAITFRRTS